MSYLNADLYDALKAANVPEALARKAAASLDSPDRLAAKLNMLLWALGIGLGVTWSVTWALLLRLDDKVDRLAETVARLAG